MLTDPLYIIWTEKNNLNIPIIDEQHRGIATIINSLHYYTKQGMSFQALMPTIIIAEQYSIIHFEAEQLILKKYGYPDYDNHFLLHAQLRENISAIKAKYFLKKDTDSVTNFLKNWWINHINIEDRKYERWLSSQNYLPGR
jgi:hemerythrin